MIKYLKRLSKSMRDENDLFMELMLAWIAIMLTAVVVLVLIGVFLA